MFQDQCPLSGCWAPWLASGAWKSVFEDLCEVSFLDLESELPTTLTEEDRALILNDFGICRNHIMSALTVKLKYWSLAPWHICGIGHPDASVARCCAAECLRQFEQRPEAKYPVRLTNKLLGPGTSLRQQIELIIGGKPLAELP